MGVVSPIGNNVEEVWDALQEGRCGIGKVTHFDTSEFRAKLAGEVKDLDMEQYFTKRELKFNDRFTQFARIAAKQAYADSGLSEDTIKADAFGVILGSGIGGIATIEGASTTLKDRGPSRVSPYFIPMALINLAPGSVAIDLGAKGNVSSVVTACAASTNAIGEAFVMAMKISSQPEEVKLVLHRLPWQALPRCVPYTRGKIQCVPASHLMRSVKASLWEKAPVC